LISIRNRIALPPEKRRTSARRIDTSNDLFSCAAISSTYPQEREVHGLVALMEIHASRSGSRVGPSGEPVPLLDQDRTR
jgi:predicted RNA polymerase sigma factor